MLFDTLKYDSFRTDKLGYASIIFSVIPESYIIVNFQYKIKIRIIKLKWSRMLSHD